MRRVSLVSGLLFFQAMASASAESTEKCHQLNTDYIRLMCYDKETGYIKATPERNTNDEVDQMASTPIAAVDGKHWLYSEERSALDNRKDVWLSVSSSNTEGNSIGSPRRATLWLRCMENKTNVLIEFERYTTDDQSVKYKFDDGNIQSFWMEPVRGGDGIGIWSGSRSIPFIRGMFDKQRMVVAYETYTGPVEFTFNISGIRSRIGPLAKECEWRP